MRQYATTADLTAEYPGTVQPANVETLLGVASLIADKALTGVVYDTDIAGLPTDTGVADTLKLAVCAIVAEWVALTLTEPGSSQQWESIGIGNVSLSTLQGASDSDSPRVDGFPVPPLAVTLLLSLGAPQVGVL